VDENAKSHIMEDDRKGSGCQPPNHSTDGDENNVTPTIAREWKQVARFMQHVSVPCVLWGIADPLLQGAVCNWRTQRYRDFLLRGPAQRHIQCGCPTLGATVRAATTELENAM